MLACRCGCKIESFESQVRQILSDVDPNLTLCFIRTMQEEVDRNLDQQRTLAQMTELLASSR